MSLCRTLKSLARLVLPVKESEGGRESHLRGVFQARQNGLIFAVILASATLVSGTVAFSPYLLVSHDPNALSLKASTSNSTVLLNQTLTVNISEFNSLRIPVELPLSGDWAIQNLTLGGCSSQAQDPFGVAVYQGRYTLGNISSAKPLRFSPDMLPGAVFHCPGVLFPAGNSARFAPHENTTYSLEFSGYYTFGFTPLPGQVVGGVFGVHHSFSAGTYTVVVGDEWGHADLLYFQVSRIGVGELVLCSQNCGYPLPGLSGDLYVNSTSPVRSLQVFVNGTDQGTVTFDKNLSSIDLSAQYSLSSAEARQVAAHHTYSLRFVVTFEDGQAFAAVTRLIAG